MYQGNMSSKKQFKLWLDPDIIDRLSSAGKKFGRSSPQEVVEELIGVYLPLWTTVNTATLRALDHQSKIIAEVHAEAELDVLDRTLSGRKQVAAVLKEKAR